MQIAVLTALHFLSLASAIGVLALIGRHYLAAR